MFVSELHTDKKCTLNTFNVVGDIHTALNQAENNILFLVLHAFTHT